VFLITYNLYNSVHYLDIKAFDIVDARCNHEDYIFSSHLTINSVFITIASTSVPIIVRIVKCCCLHSQITWQIDMLVQHIVTVTDGHHSNMIFV